MINLGYAAVNTALRKQDIYTNRTITLKKILEKGLDELKRLASKNIADLKTIVQWNEDHGIRFYRVTSNLFPHIDNPKLDDIIKEYNVVFARNQLKEVGDLCKKYGHRITMHPPQFVQLGSPNPNVVATSIRTLVEHVEILTAMGLTPSDGSCLILHLGGTYKDKPSALLRWITVYEGLPAAVKKYIVLENDEWYWSVSDLLPVCEKLNIPFCLDVFHNSISDDKIKITRRLLRRIFATWKQAQPKFHYSEQNKYSRKGAHSQNIRYLPKWLLNLPEIMNLKDFYIMLEVKDKEQSVLRMYNKYFSKTTVDGKVVWLRRS